MQFLQILLSSVVKLSLLSNIKMNWSLVACVPIGDLERQQLTV